MSDYRSSDSEYYKKYYADKGDIAYLGSKQKHESRFLVFKEWLTRELKPGAKVLDVGCGDAAFAQMMPEFEWYGVDMNIEKATVLDPARVFSQNLMEPPYPFNDSTFDAIICSEVLEHLWDLRVVHKEVKRLLKRDGTYYLSTPNFDWITNHLEHHTRLMQTPEAHWTFEHIRHYNYQTHKRFLNDCGFSIELVTGADGHYCPIIANVCRGIRDGLRRDGIEVDEYRLHQLAGEGLPQYQHTIILKAKKV